MTAVPHPTRIFISFARKDLEHLRALETHLANLKRQKRITVWTDKVLEPGERWEQVLLEALRDADILLCLVTPDFMASNFIHDVELKESFERERLGQVRIVPIHLRPTDLQGHALDAHQGLPRNFKPVTEWRNRDRAWLEVVTGLRTVLDKPLMPQDVPQPLPGGYETLFEDHPPSALLVARYRVVPFFQALRASELERIHTWLEQERRFDVLLITGDAGTGKTRLLYEVIERRREACWVAGLVDARTPFDALKAELQEVLAIPHPVLLAVDYAETSPELGRLLTWLQAQSHKRPKPLRVLLAARGAGDWWQNLQIPLNLALSTLLKAPPLAVGAIPAESTPEALTELYRESLQCFAGALGMPTPEPLPVESPEPESLAFESLDRRPLFVLLTALAQTLGLPTKRETLLEALIHHEQQFWRSLLPEHAYDQDPVLVDTHRLVAAVTLRGGVRSEPELKALFERLAPVPELTLTRARSFMRRVYPGAGLLWVRPVEPDLLGAELVRQVLVKHGTDALLEPALADNNPEALATAFRLLEDIGQENEALSRRSLAALLSNDIEARALPALQAATRRKGDRPVRVIADVLLERLKQGVSVGMLATIHDALPFHSLALAELALWVTSALKVLHSSGDMTLYAAFLNNEGNRLSELGRREEALEITLEAVSINRRLAAQSSDGFSPNLAMSLSNLGNRLAAKGQREAALKATQEAVELYRALEHRSPGKFTFSLAQTLSNLGLRLSTLEEGKPALQATQEAASLLRSLEATDPNLYAFDLAGCLNNLASRLAGLGRGPEALVIAREAVGRYQQLANKLFDSVIPGLSSSLNNLGNILSMLDKADEASKVLGEAVQLRRVLSEGSPEAFMPSLAQSLVCYAKSLMEAGQPGEASTVAREAVSLYQRLATSRPEVFEYTYALSLSNYGAILTMQQQQARAQTPIEEASRIYRKLRATSPTAFTGDFAICLNNLGDCLGSLGRWDEATASYREAVELLTPLFERLPQVHWPQWLSYARNLRTSLQQSNTSPTSDPQLEWYMALLAQIEPQLPKP